MKKNILILQFFLLFNISVFAQGDRYVAPDGTGQGRNGWADATDDLPGAVRACSSGSTVWVSNGVYVLTNTLSIGAGVVVRSKSGLPADVIIDGNKGGYTAVSGGSIVGVTVRNGLVNMGWGAGVQNLTAYNCIISGNVGTGGNQGGGAYGSTLYNCLIIGNSHLEVGGAYRCTLYNCTVSGNNTAYNYASGVGASTMINSISWGNGAGADVFNEGASNYYSCGSGYSGVGSINTDPLFVGGTDYRLKTNSPCRNVGFNYSWMTDVSGLRSRDLDANMRIWPEGGRTDMGAYESGSKTNYPLSHTRVRTRW